MALVTHLVSHVSHHLSHNLSYHLGNHLSHHLTNPFSLVSSKSLSLNNFCSVSTGLGLNTLQISWSRRVLVSTSLKISSLEKSRSWQLLYFESCTFTVNYLYVISAASYFYLIISCKNQKLRTYFHWMPLFSLYIIIQILRSIFLYSVLTLRP